MCVCVCVSLCLCPCALCRGNIHTHCDTIHTVMYFYYYSNIKGCFSKIWNVRIFHRLRWRRSKTYSIDLHYSPECLLNTCSLNSANIISPKGASSASIGRKHTHTRTRTRTHTHTHKHTHAHTPQVELFCKLSCPNVFPWQNWFKTLTFTPL